MDANVPFSLLRGRCYRMVRGDTGGDDHEHLTHCPEPAEFRGVLVTKDGKHWKVDSCLDHAADLTAPQRMFGEEGGGTVDIGRLRDAI